MTVNRRVTADEVKDLIDTTLTDGRIETYITSAAVYVETAVGTKFDDEYLKELQRWMTAHLISTTNERQLQKATAGPAGATYFGVAGKGLESSTYGQTVLNLDTTGTFAEINNQYKTTRIEAL